MFAQDKDSFSSDLFIQSVDNFFGPSPNSDIFLNESLIQSNLGFSNDYFEINSSGPDDILKLPQPSLDMPKPQNFFLQKKRSNENEESISENINNISFKSNKSKIKLKSENENDQWNENNNNNNIKENPKKISSTKEDSKNKKIIVPAQIAEIKKGDINNERSSQKDNFSINLFTKINAWIINDIISKYPNLKIYRPNYYFFTHNTNMTDIYIYLDIQYKNIVCITPEIKEELDLLLIGLKIKKKCKRKETQLTEKSKEYKGVLKLLIIYKYINENDKLDIDKVNKLIIKLLITEGYKDANDDKLYKKDKDNINHLLIKNNLKKSYDYQNKNRNNINGHEISEINKTLRELIILFYKSGKEFENFSQETEKIIKINENIKIQKYNKYSLLDNSECNGFIKMIEEDCGLNDKQKEAVRDFTNYFHDRELSIEELKKYRDIALLKKKA